MSGGRAGGALVTGASRRAGIGFATCELLRGKGHDVFAHGFGPGDNPVDLEADLADPGAPERVLAAATERLGHVDVLVANHAADCEQGLGQLTAEAIDRTLAINVRATLLLVQAFAARHDGRPGGRVILLTSGQDRSAMARELPYAASKGALAGVTRSLAAALADRGITVNAVDPGPTDTGWATPEQRADALARMPFGRWGEPADAARLIAWLTSADAGWITGEVIHSDGGYSM